MFGLFLVLSKTPSFVEKIMFFYRNTLFLLDLSLFIFNHAMCYLLSIGCRFQHITCRTAADNHVSSRIFSKWRCKSQPKNLQPQSMAAAQAQIQSSGMVNSMGMGMAGTGMLNAGGMGHTPDQQQYFMQQMAQMQAQQQQRQQAQMGLGMGMDNVAGGFQQLEQVSSSHGVGGFGGDSAAAAAAGGGGGLNHPGAFIQQPAGVGSVDKDSSNGNSIPSAPAMVPMNVINPSGAPLDADAQAQQDRLIQQQQLLQQQHQKLLEQQELLRQLQEQQRALQQQQMQAVQLEQQQQNMTGGHDRFPRSSRWHRCHESVHDAEYAATAAATPGRLYRG